MFGGICALHIYIAISEGQKTFIDIKNFASAIYASVAQWLSVKLEIRGSVVRALPLLVPFSIDDARLT
jgi:hypothetical protein